MQNEIGQKWLEELTKAAEDAHVKLARDPLRRSPVWFRLQKYEYEQMAKAIAGCVWEKLFNID